MPYFHTFLSLRYRYAMINEFTECNATCGKKGVKFQKYKCELTSNEVDEYHDVKLFYCEHLGKPNYPSTCEGPPCGEGNETSNTTLYEISNETIISETDDEVSSVEK